MIKHKTPTLRLVIIFSLVSSRARTEPELSVGLKAGPNASTLSEDYRFSRYGLSGGGVGCLRWALADGFFLGGQLDLLYAPRGAKTIFEGDYLGQTRQHYFDFAAAARPEMRIGLVNAYLLLGASLNLLESASRETASGDKQDITEGIRRVDVALLAGGGVVLPLPHLELGPFRQGTLFVEMRHDHGLIDTDANAGGFKNRNTSLMLGLSFVPGSEHADGQPVSPPARSETAASVIIAE